MSSLPKLLALTLGYSLLQGNEEPGNHSLNKIIMKRRNGTTRIHPSIAVEALMRKLRASEERRKKLEEENRRLRRSNAKFKVMLNPLQSHEERNKARTSKVAVVKPEPMEEGEEADAELQPAAVVDTGASHGPHPSGGPLRSKPEPSPAVPKVPPPTQQRQRSSNNSSEVFKCEICSICLRGFPGWDTYDRHMDTTHAEGAEDSCPLCGAATFDLPGHRRDAHATDLPYVCGVCSSRFANRWNLQNHLPQHARDAAAAALQEGRRYGRTYQRRSRQVAVNADDSTGAALVPAYLCRVCPARFGSRTALAEHCRSSHSDSRPFVCKACGRRFKHRVSLKIHSQLHWEEKRSHSCEVCGVSFPDQERLEAHVHRHETPQRLTCKECGSAFRHPEALRAHVKELHEGANHLCAFCGRAFAALHALLSHETCHRA